MDAAAGDNSDPEHDPRAVTREARAERYFEHDLAGQRRWYGEGAGDRAPASRAVTTAISNRMR